MTVRLFLVTHEVINREHHLADFTVEARLVPCLEGTEKKKKTKRTVSGLPPDSGLTDVKVKELRIMDKMKLRFMNYTLE